MGETVRLQEYRQNTQTQSRSHGQSRKQELCKAQNVEETVLICSRFTKQTASSVSVQYKLFQAHSLQLSGEHHFPIPSPSVQGYDKFPDSFMPLVSLSYLKDWATLVKHVLQILFKVVSSILKSIGLYSVKAKQNHRSCRYEQLNHKAGDIQSKTVIYTLKRKWTALLVLEVNN